MAVAFSRATPRHWVYLNTERTHELHAQFTPQPDGGLFVTTEFPMGSREVTEMVQSQSPAHGEAELANLLKDLEGRLALTGRYFRTEAGRLDWTALETTPPPIDLRAQEIPIPGMEATGGRMKLHHFHGATSGRDRLVISMPRPGMSGRHVLAQLEFAFPHVEDGDMSVLHPRLAPALLASVVAREHVEAPRRGFAKLFAPHDYERAYGGGWFEKTKGMLQRASARIVGGPAPIIVEPRRPPAPPARLDQIRAALASPRIEALKAQYVDAVTEAMLVEGGEHTIRRYVGGLRRKVTHLRAYEISLLEAALLTEYAIPTSMWDLAAEEGAKLLRYVFGTYDA